MSLISFFCSQLNDSKYCYVSLKIQSFVYTLLNDQQVLFLAIQFSRSHLFPLILNDANDGVLCIPQSSSFTGASSSNCLVSRTLIWLEEGSYPSAEIQSVYSTAPADWAKHLLSESWRCSWSQNSNQMVE